MQHSLRIFVALLTLTIGASTFGSINISFIPPTPTERDAVTADVSGIWTDSCIPRNPTVTRAGAEIRIDLRTISLDENVVCATVMSAWRSLVPLGMLEAGTYRVSVFIRNASGVREEETETLAVTAAEPVIVPSTIPIGGGTVAIKLPPALQLCASEQSCSKPQVKIDGQTVDTVFERGPMELHVVLPPHATGSADVTLVGRDGTTTVELPDVLHYFDPDGEEESAMFERVLLPLPSGAAGAGGSQWVTEYTIFNAVSIPVPLRTPPSSCILPCSDVPAQQSATMFFEQPARLLRPLRTLADNLQYNATLRELSKNSGAWGVEIPVVREREFLTGAVDLLNVPRGERFRYTLRIYGLRASATTVVIQAFPLRNAIVEPAPHIIAHLDNGGCTNGRCVDFPTFGMVSNIPGLATADTGPVRLRIQSTDPNAPIWAFLSITDNETQQVTTITPQ